jgi:two-component system, NtrC family, response regulator HydG
LEAELFGYKKGAFSGADRDHPGLFQQADEGTLLLDEVGELSLECQAKLLRVIEGKAFRPVGATSDIKVDVRIVAATHRDLEKDVKAGRFRQDLLFRLKVIQIRVPPLREHPEDIPELAAFFLAKVSSECRRNFKLTTAAMRKLQAYPWPGNVRQLRAAIESAAVMSEGDTIEAEAIPLVGVTEPVAPAATAAAQALDVPPSLNMDEIEEWAICRAMRQTGGNVSHAAKLLNMSRDTLHNKLNKLKKEKGIDRAALTNTPIPTGSPDAVSAEA